MSRVAFVIAVAALVLACESSTELVAIDRFSASLNGAQVKPTAVAGTGSGSFTITLTSRSDTLAYDLAFDQLRSIATNAHIHGPAGDSVTAPVILNLDSLASAGQGTLQLGTSGSAQGWILLGDAVTTTIRGDSLFKLLHAGLLYVDVHAGSAADPEIRGQISKR